jgi:nitrate/TMAO reductase-like tetraheme cytochrome c subunit
VTIFAPVSEISPEEFRRVTGERTCVDYHKGIAHELPEMTGIDPRWRAA